MDVPSYVILGLQISGGTFWTLTYLLIIKRGFQDRTYGMPWVALCANISWEFIFTFVHPHHLPQWYINLIWFILDLIIVYQVLRYGPLAPNSTLPKRLFYPTFLITLAIAFGVVLTMTYEFNDWDGMYSAFGMNLLISILFVDMLHQRQSLDGQSLYIALFKMIGTACSSIWFHFLFPNSHLLNLLYLSIFLFDGIYVVYLYQNYLKLNINPWQRL